MRTYDIDTPDGSVDDPAEAADRMNEIKFATQEREDVDHYWPLTGSEVSDTDAAEHRKLTLRTLSAVEVAALTATKAYLYRLVTDGELYFKDDDDNTIKLTSGGKILSASLDMKDEDDMASDSNTHTYTQQAIKAYADAVAAVAAAALKVVQVVNTQTGAVATGTTLIPNDDTIPQSNEGDEYMTLAITPTSATNKLKIEVVMNLAHNSTGSRLVAALFQDIIANALAVSWGSKDSSANAAGQVKFTHYMDAGTIVATTFKVRAGTSTGGTTTFNGINGVRRYGGLMASSITITEIKV